MALYQRRHWKVIISLYKGIWINFLVQNNPTDQLKDAMSRLIERSHPEIIYYQQQFKNLKFCSICNSSHHMTKNHHKYPSPQKSTVENEYDTLVSDILIQSKVL